MNPMHSQHKQNIYRVGVGVRLHQFQQFLPPSILSAPEDLLTPRADLEGIWRPPGGRENKRRPVVRKEI